MDTKTIFATIRGISLREKITFTKNLSLIVKAGMSLPQGLEILSKESDSPKLQLVLEDVKNQVVKGKEFSQGLSNYPGVFDSFYISMVKTGEASGTLEESLRSLASHMGKERTLRSKVIGALIYPAIIVIVMGIVLTATMLFVVPRLTVVFQNFNATLPLSTRILIGFSNFMTDYFYVIIGGGLFILVALWYFFARVTQGKILLSWLTLHIPLLKTLTKKLNVARFARTLQTLIKSGMATNEALSITSTVLQNYYYQGMVLQARREMEKGKPLNGILKSFPRLYPPLASQLVAVGEETGSLDLVLENLADFYEEELDSATKNLSATIEPLLMVIIGISVGFLALSLLQPIYSLTNSIGT